MATRRDSQTCSQGRLHVAIVKQRWVYLLDLEAAYHWFGLAAPTGYRFAVTRRETEGD